MFVSKARRSRWAVGSAIALAVALGLAGCTGKTVSVSVPEKDAGQTTPDRASLRTGDTLEVDFGEVNPSVGDSWYLLESSSPSVLRDLGDDLKVESHARSQAGAGGELTWRFEAAAPGRTELRFQYCFRTAPPDCEDNEAPAPEPVRLAVTVRE